MEVVVAVVVVVVVGTMEESTTNRTQEVGAVPEVVIVVVEVLTHKFRKSRVETMTVLGTTRNRVEVVVLVVVFGSTMEETRVFQSCSVSSMGHACSWGGVQETVVVVVVLLVGWSSIGCCCCC